MKSQTVTFRDGNTEWRSSMSSSDDSTRLQTVHQDVSLSDFFARPIQIHSSVWTPGTPYVAQVIDPWSLFITNPRVANRISNYALFSGKLHLKIMVNGNSFYYGRLMAYYLPMPLVDSGNETPGSIGAFIQGSQKLKVFVNPCDSTGGELECPFMWPYDMVGLTTTTGGYSELGRLVIAELNSLKHANGSTGSVSLSVYAWMEDVKLSAPTEVNVAGLTAQAKDEYGDGPISAVASAVSGVAGRMSSMPIIGKYARATEIGAGAMSAVAKLFGFSRPIAVEPPKLIRHHNVGELAVTNVSDTSNKLTCDVKQEVSVDPSIVGVGTGDEMGIADIAARESYLTTFPWSTLDIPDIALWSARVGPCYGYSTSDAIGTRYIVPSCMYAAYPFKYWRGVMKYRFQIVASDYHKGRLKFVWDPVFASSSPESNVTYTKIVDLASERDFTLDIPWGQRQTYLQVTTPPATGVYRTGTVFNNAALATWNGVLSVYVLNDLTTPNSTVNNDININVFVSMCDAEFAVPTEAIRTVSQSIGAVVQSADEGLVPQADVEDSVNQEDDAPQMGTSKESMVECTMDFGPLSTVYMGEKVVSFRALMKRFAIDWIWGFANATNGDVTINMPDFPLVYGYTDVGFQTGTINKFNTANTTLMRYLAMAFVAYRGGVRRKYVSVGSFNDTAPVATQITRNSNTTVAAPVYTAPVTSNDIAASIAYTGTYSSGLEGSALITAKQNQSIEVELPYYRAIRFSATRTPVTAVSGIGMSVDDLTHKIVTSKGAISSSRLISYVSAAEDSSFFCFQGCRAFYVSPTLT